MAAICSAASVSSFTPGRPSTRGITSDNAALTRRASVVATRRRLRTVCSAAPGTDTRNAKTAGGATSGSSSSGGGGSNGSSGSGESSGPSPFASFVGVDYYRILGVPVGATPVEIRRAYRALQKKYHPDVAGNETHSYALRLNEAYDTLMDDTRRHAYEREWKAAAVAGYVGFTGQPRSEWSAPEGQTQAFFVDEHACVGCRQCVHAAGRTFAFDSDAAVARVHTQWGDPLWNIQAAIDSCPVSCIHTVHRDDLAALEFLVQPRRKTGGAGVFGGGWEQGPVNIFVAAREFRRKVHSQQEEAKRRRAASTATANESAAQRAAREAAAAAMDGRGAAFWQQWMAGWGGRFTRTGEGAGEGEAGWGSSSARDSPPAQPGFIGTAASAEVLRHRAPHHQQKGELVSFLQEWGRLWSYSSELPLPLPVRTDALPSGVALTLVGMRGDAIAAVGSLEVTVEPLDGDANGQEGGQWAFLFPGWGESSVPPAGMASDANGGGGLETDDAKEDGEDECQDWVVVVRRKSATDTRSLPGESTIVRALRDALTRRGSMRGYEAYHLPSGPQRAAK